MRYVEIAMVIMATNVITALTSGRIVPVDAASTAKIIENSLICEVNTSFKTNSFGVTQ
jgi:hypothetical protein